MTKIEKQRANCRKYYWSDPEKARARGREYQRVNREKVKESKRARRAKNPEHHSKLSREANARYRAANPERVRELTRSRMQRWRIANRDKANASQRQRYRDNIEKMRQYGREWRRRRMLIPECVVMERLKRKAWYDSNTDKARAFAKKYHRKYREKRRVARLKYYALNKDKILARQAKNKDRYRTAKNRRQRERYAMDPNYRMRCRLAIAIWGALKGRRKSAPTMKLLGCSLENFWIHLESQFKEGMTRQNYGNVWHVDHIMPCSIFDLSKPEHQRRCFHFSNLQPLFGPENLAKGAKVFTNQFQLI